MKVRMSSDPGFELKPTSSPLPAAEREKLMKDLGFGRVFTEHMVTIRYRAPDGWGKGLLSPYAPISLDPGGLGAPLRASHLRRLQGLSPARWRDLDLPPRGQRSAFQQFRCALGHARAARRALRGSRRPPDPPRAGLGAAEFR